jgi:hypothetical protein
MSRYTTAGYGDGTYPDPPEDTRPQCARCNEHFKPASDEIDIYCSGECWLLANMDECKAQIQCWRDQGCDNEKIVDYLYHGDWFIGVTGATVDSVVNYVLGDL